MDIKQVSLALVSSLTLIAQANAGDQHARVSLGEASTFNAVIFNDFNAPSSQIEGRVAVGGDISISSYSIADKLEHQDDSYSVMVGGDLNFGNGRVYSGHLLVEGSAADTGDGVRHGLTAEQVFWDNIDVPMDFSQLQQDLIAESNYLTSIPTNGVVKSEWGGLYLEGDCNSDLQVFELEGAAILSSHTFQVSCIPADATVLFNIFGESVGFKYLNLASLSQHNSRVLFNFHQATELTLNGVMVEGSILAPKADIVGATGSIKGTLVANSWQGSMSFLHYPNQAYNPDLNLCEGSVEQDI